MSERVNRGDVVVALVWLVSLAGMMLWSSMQDTAPPRVYRKDGIGQVLRYAWFFAQGWLAGSPVVRLFLPRRR